MKFLRVLADVAIRIGLPMLAGVALALLLAPLWLATITVPFVAWFEAVGAWVGGLATVGALLWAVRSFRADMDLRRREGIQRQRDADALETKRASTAIAEVRSGGGYGNTGSKTMNSVVVDFKNNGTSPIEYRRVQLNAPYKQKQRLARGGIRVKPNEMQRVQLTIEDVSVGDNDLSGAMAIGAVVEYSIDDVVWTRETGPGGSTEPMKGSLEDHAERTR